MYECKGTARYCEAGFDIELIEIIRKYKSEILCNKKCKDIVVMRFFSCIVKNNSTEFL